MKKNIFSFLASLRATFFVLSFFYIVTYPSLQTISSNKTGSVMTEYGENFPWKVERGETIYSIAYKWYGDNVYWTTIWDDNPWIKDPNMLETDWVLEMRYEKPVLPSPLKPDLAALNRNNLSKPSSFVASLASRPVVNGTIQAINNAGGVLNEEQINFLGKCESGMTAGRNSGNGFYGAFQFSPGTWRSMNTGYERADIAPIEVQKEAVQRLLLRSSIFSQFPGCSRRMQAIGMI